MRVYIAGKLNGMAVDYTQNMHRMMTWGEVIRRRGYAVFIPCLDVLMGTMFGGYSYEDYFNNSQEWLDASHALFVCPESEGSKGLAKEIKRAEARGIPVCYTLEELDKVREDYERMAGRPDAALSGLHKEPGESRDVPRLELDRSHVSNLGQEHLVE
jgi:hypothetical protein